MRLFRLFMIGMIVFSSLISFTRCGERDRTQTAKTLGELQDDTTGGNTMTRQQALPEDCMRTAYGMAKEQLAAGLITPQAGCRLASYKVMEKRDGVDQEVQRFCLPDAKNLSYDEYQKNRSTITCTTQCREGATIFIGGDCSNTTVIFCNECEGQ